MVSAAGLAGIGIWPNYLFPILWVSPVLIIISLQALLRERHILSEISDGDWSGAVAAALAAILCGWIWEMWNYFSLPNGNIAFLWFIDLTFLKCRFWDMPDIFHLDWNAW